MHKSFDSEVDAQIGVEPTIVADTARRAADHEFGSQATDLKLSLLGAYSRAFTTALRGKFAELWYIDAFAGTGERTERVPVTHSWAR